MTKKQKKNLQRILLTAAGFVLVTVLKHLVELPVWLLAVLYFALYLLISYDVLKKTWKNIKNKDFMDENFLMSVASLGAFFLQEFPEAVAVMLFYQVGEWFQSYALDKSRKSITELMDIRPDYANLLKDGKTEQVSPEEVAIGDTIVIEPGERVPLDGIIETGTSTLDTAALTGESVPRTVRPGDEVISGCINQNGVLYVKVEKDYDHSTVSRILDLVENATEKKSRSEQFITKFARVYTPAVVFAAIALFAIPSLITGDWSTWLYRSLEFLVISCPCALVVSIPLSFFGGIGGASRNGILVKGSTYLQDMAEVKTMVFDKTGTLTKGTFAVTNVDTADPALNSEELLTLCARAESFSTHPIAQCIVRSAKLSDPREGVSDVQEVAGKGVTAVVNKKAVACGNQKLMELYGIDPASLPKPSPFGTSVYVAVDQKFAGVITAADEPKEDAKVVIDLLKKEGVKDFIMLTGDQEEIAKSVAGQIGITEVHAKLLPANKVEIVEQILQRNQNSKSKTAFIGDGINDAPVLTRVDVGVAMGALGSDAAIEAADIVLMDDQLSSLVTLMQISRKTLRIATENIVFAIVVKVLMLVLGALGIVNMWGAVFADVGVSVLCILNAIRMIRFKKKFVAEI